MTLKIKAMTTTLRAAGYEAKRIKVKFKLVSFCLKPPIENLQ